MFESEITRVFLSILLGASIGIERESRGGFDHSLGGGGLRTFSLVALMGALSGLAYVKEFTLVFAIFTSAFASLLLAYYILSSYHTKNLGLTTEIAFLLTYMFGFLISSGVLSSQIVIALTVIVTLILSLSEELKRLFNEVKRHEIEGFIAYAIIALVIYPFLPNQAYTLAQIPGLDSLITSPTLSSLEIINPQKIWLVIALVTGIDCLGYLLSKFIGEKRGFTVASLIGGFISSTSVTQSLAQKSRNDSNVKYLVGAALLANTASFFQIFLLVGPLNSAWLASLLPTLLIMITTASLLAFYYLKNPHTNETSSNTGTNAEKKLFALIPAFKYAGIILLVKIFTKACLLFFGQSGFLFSSIIASLAGLDAVLINLADLAGKSLDLKFAVLVFILVNATNLTSKTIYSYIQGSRKFTYNFALGSLIIIGSSFIGYFISKI